MLKEKMKNRLKSGIDLSKMVEDKFRKQVSVFHIQQVLKEHGLNDPVGRKAGKHKIKMRIHAHKTSTLLRYVRTRFFLPAIGMERPIERDSYDGKTLGAITSPDGRHVRYRATDRFLRELTALEIGDDLSLALAGRYDKTFSQ
jgi:hypothetical protein